MLAIKKHHQYAFIAILADIFAVVLSYILAYYFRFSGFIIPLHKGIPDIGEYMRILVFIVPIYIFTFRSYNLYRPERHIRRIYELLNVVKAVTIATIICMALTFVYREFSYSRAVLFSAWILSMILCCLVRYFLIEIEYFFRKNGSQSRVLLIGMSRSARNLIRWAKENKHYGKDIVGVIAANGRAEQGKHFDGVPVAGSLLDFNQYLETHPVDEVIVADATLPHQTASELMLQCESKMINFKLVADFYGLMTRHVDVEYLSNVPLLGLKELPLDDPWNRVIKRLFDLIVSTTLLIFLSPLFALICVLIKGTSEGPLFYVQERVGRDEKKFRLYKFRTMRTDAEKVTGPVWAQSNDPRTTRIGRFLRRGNLDELPQLWNVVKGDMSLVGPRPERPHFVKEFRNQVPRYMSRHKIQSGLTGWAQIHGLRGNTALEERIKYDLYYMENWTLMMDLEILFATLFAFKNAY